MYFNDAESAAIDADSGSSSGGSIAPLDTQRVGRMGELVVELELLKRGWIVGNFNSTTMNSAGWDLFATQGTRSVKIRVKAKRPGVDCFRWSAKADGSVLAGLANTDDDFVAAVSFDRNDGYEVFVLPSNLVEETLYHENARWLSGSKAGGGARKPTTMRHIYINDRDDGAPAHGFAVHWAPYRNAWHLLEPAGQR